MARASEIAERDNEIAYLKRELAQAREALTTARTVGSDIFDESTRLKSELSAMRAENVRQREEIGELRGLLQGATANSREALSELDALATHVGHSVQPPDWLPTRVAEHGVTTFARRWLGRSTPNSARVAGRVIEAAHD